MNKRVSREGRAFQVVRDLETYGPALTELQLAELQGVKKTPYFRSILEDLVVMEVLIVQWVKGSNRQPTRYFSVKNQAKRLEGS